MEPRPLASNDPPRQADDPIVVTGAGGFIGGNLVQYFHDKGFTRIRAAGAVEVYNLAADNNAVPHTSVRPEVAKARLGVASSNRAILFFGNIGPYKGLELLVGAFQRLAAANPAYRLIIAGLPRGGSESYWEDVRRAIDADSSRKRIIQRIEYVPDVETELYFKMVDVLVLPYQRVFQSGVLFLGYSFGLPVIATDIASLRKDIVEGQTGFLCRPTDPVDLADVIERYFESDLYKDLDLRRREIQDHARARNSWDVVGRITANVYADLVGQGR